MQKYTILSLCLVLTACSATYKQNDMIKNQARINVNHSIIIATPVDGFYESKIYYDSGKSTAAAIKAAFSKHSLSQVDVSSCQKIDCLRNDVKDIYVIPEILHWEDRATEWSGIPDKIEVKITIYDYHKQIISSSVINGKSKWATFGGDHPQDLLKDPIDQYVDSLY